MTETPPVGAAAQPETPDPPAQRWWSRVSVRTRVALLVAAVVAIAAVILVPRLLVDDPLDAVGPEGSPARRVAAALDESMDCTAGEISAERAVLGCYHQSANRIALVFAQTDSAGEIASYTAEAHALSVETYAEETIALANQVAAVVTPGADFTGCSHDRSTPFFCFDSFATWTSPSLAPLQTTGEKKRLPGIEELDASFGKLGWDCSFGICSKGPATMLTEQPPTGLGLQYGGSPGVPEQKKMVSALLELVERSDGLQEWANGIDGRLSIIVTDRFVAGFVPQAGGSALFVIDEIAGLVPDTA